MERHTGATVPMTAAANQDMEAARAVFVGLNADGNVEPVAAGNRYVGISLEPAWSGRMGRGVMEVAQMGRTQLKVNAHATNIAIGDSIVPAAGGVGVKKGGAVALTDRCIALEAASTDGAEIFVVLR